jgi:Cft2 family RNA processing exonuclease
VRGLTAFCAETVASGGTPAIAAYSLGKSQEVLAALGDSGLPVMLHAAAAKMTRVYEGLGRAFPSWKPLDAASCRGHVLIVPPGATAPLRRSLPRLRVASVSGWAVDTSHRHRAGADATFALSDHADFPGLLEFVRRVGPQRVFTLHGFAADFASHLRSLGLRAEALDDRGQMELPLGAALSPRARRRQDRATTCNAA